MIVFFLKKEKGGHFAVWISIPHIPVCMDNGLMVVFVVIAAVGGLGIPPLPTNLLSVISFLLSLAVTKASIIMQFVLYREAPHSWILCD